MEDNKFAEVNRVDLIFDKVELMCEKVKKLDIVEDILNKVLSLRDEISAVNEFLAIHRGELDKVHKKQNELEQELHIIRNLSQSDEIIICM